MTSVFQNKHHALVGTPKVLNSKAQGRAAHPGFASPTENQTPTGFHNTTGLPNDNALCNAFGVGNAEVILERIFSVGISHHSTTLTASREMQILSRSERSTLGGVVGDLSLPLLPGEANLLDQARGVVARVVAATATDHRDFFFESG